MIPILFESTEMQFTTNGLCRLIDCTSCLVTEKRNGKYEVEFKYPTTGRHFSEITKGRIIAVSHDEQGDIQPFVIYRRSAPMNGVCTFSAQHISYELSKVIVTPFTATSPSDAMAHYESNTVNTNRFIFWTDNVSAGTMKVSAPSTIRATLGGIQGSFLDIYGGEYEWDKFTVKNHASRGADNGVTIRYGKNLKSLTHTSDQGNIYYGILPYWVDGEGNCVYGSIVYLSGMSGAAIVKDYSQDFQDQPTTAQLEAKARDDLQANTPWVPSVNIKLDFVALWQTEEYKNIAPIERVRLCDTVTVIYPELDVTATAKVITVVWDVLLDRYNTIELGDARSSLAQTVRTETQEVIAKIPIRGMLQSAIDHATELITGGLGGNVVFTFDADGQPIEISVMDTKDKSTAINVWRWNLGGFAHSHNGYNGPFTDVALTADGYINASRILTGFLEATRIKGGTLTLGGAGNGSGVLQVLDANGDVIGSWDNTGAVIRGDVRLIKKIEGQYSTQYFVACLMEHDWYEPSTSGTGVPSVVVNEVTGNSFRAYYSAQNRNIFLAPETNKLVFNSGYNAGKIVSYNGDPQNNTGRGADIELDYPFIIRAYSITGQNVSQFRFGNGAVSCWHSYNGSQLTSFNITQSSILLGDTNGSKYVDISSGDIKISGGSDTSINLNDDNTGSGTFRAKSQELKFINNKLSLNGNNFAYDTSSSKRYKKDISEDIDENLDPHKLYDLRMKQFRYKDGALLQYEDMAGQLLPGFIAEDVFDIYPSAAIRNKEGEIESWDERRIVPGMLTLIQEQKKQIDDLTTRVERLEKLLLEGK